MTPFLTEELHTDECVVLIRKYHACHKQYPALKFIGWCNGADRELRRCLRKEMEERRMAHIEKSVFKRQQKEKEQSQ